MDVRVIAATNKDLQEEIKLGSFREDLYYRLNVIPIHLTPLRERGRDILVHANFFFEQLSLELGEPTKCFSSEAENNLLSYHWPGNVRELRNLVERLSILVTSRFIEVDDLPDYIKECKVDTENLSEPNSPATLKEARSHFEKSFIIEKLEEHGWNISKTAEAIGVERSNLHRKLRNFGIDLKRLKM